MSSTVADCLKRASELAVVSDSARLDTELLLGHVLEKDRAWLFTWPDKSLSAESLKQFNVLFDRRKKGEPVAHILGEREFWSLPFYVNSSTLIPRPDTELLVETVLTLVSEPKAILDLGTGTGAIALALASEYPNATVVGVDASPQAVALAHKNQQRLQFNHTRFFESDWFSAVESQQFDIIVSNPPYIDGDDPHLNEGDVRFEPASALIAKDKGLADIRTIVQQAKDYLADNGLLLLEHGWQQAQIVRTIFEENGYSKIETRKDLGDYDRITLGWKHS